MRIQQPWTHDQSDGRSNHKKKLQATNLIIATGCGFLSSIWLAFTSQHKNIPEKNSSVHGSWICTVTKYSHSHKKRSKNLCFSSILMLKIIITSDNLYLPLFHDMMVVDLVHLMNHNVVQIYHNYKDFNSFSVLSPENEISDIFISFYFTKVFPNKKIWNFDRQC